MQTLVSTATLGVSPFAEHESINGVRRVSCFYTIRLLMDTDISDERFRLRINWQTDIN